MEITSSSCRGGKSNNRAPKKCYFFLQLNSFLFFLANEWILGPSIVVLEETFMFWSWAWLVGGSMPSWWEVGHVNYYIYQFKFARAPSFSKAQWSTYTKAHQLWTTFGGPNWKPKFYATPNILCEPIYNNNNNYYYYCCYFFFGGGEFVWL